MNDAKRTCTSWENIVELPKLYLIAPKLLNKLARPCNNFVRLILIIVLLDEINRKCVNTTHIVCSPQFNPTWQLHTRRGYCVSIGIPTDHERKFKYGLRFKFATHMYVVQSYFYKFNMSKYKDQSSSYLLFHQGHFLNSVVFTKAKLMTRRNLRQHMKTNSM